MVQSGYDDACDTAHGGLQIREDGRAEASKIVIERCRYCRCTTPSVYVPMRCEARCSKSHVVRPAPQRVLGESYVPPRVASPPPQQ